MEKPHILIPVELDVFWYQLKTLVEQVLGERDRQLKANNDDDEPKLLKTKEVCNLFQVSKPTIYEWMRNGQLRSFKIASRRFFLASDIAEMIDRQKNKQG